MKTIAVVAEKGGIGKTTTSQAIIEILRHEGFRVLAIDADQQANLTYALNADIAPYSLYDLLTKRKTAKEVIFEDNIKATDYISLLYKEKTISIKTALAPIASNYDFAVIDTPPKLDKNIMRVLVATDFVILPTFADAFSFKGLDKIFNIIKEAQKENTKLQISGVLFTMYNDRNILNRQLKELIEDKCKQNKVNCFKTTINRNIAISEAQAMRQPLAKYNNRTKAIKDYKAFVKELLEILK